MDKAIISNIYDLAKEKYGKKPFTFEQLWKELVKKLKLDKDEQAQVGHVYSSMLQDHRFIFSGNNQWKLREYLTLEEQADLSNALYDFKQEEIEEKRRVADLSKKMDNEEMFYDEEEQEILAKEKAQSLDDEDIEDSEEKEEIEEDEEDA